MSGRNPYGIETLKQYPKALRHARAIAKPLGYAIGLHGSRTYDLDLIACPWTETCATPQDLAAALASGLGWYLHKKISEKPHGRLGFTLYSKIAGHAHIDLSVMPRIEEK